ncbi:hypothetical protein FGO68_gene14052 [Halteria grandinella]|uniref:RING-type domain-containing protein n=1 Tax=Halteria grandinella TaxID=5974 RepID=A0A8J8NN18_HALGN|nr:hypothetical protein FGO68_gene14052 [Halteria grandinella]
MLPFLGDISPLLFEDVFDVLIIAIPSSTKYREHQQFDLNSDRDDVTTPMQTLQSCPICLQEMADTHFIAMPCTSKHACHPECLLSWLKQKNSCPLCKCLINLETLIASWTKHEASSSGKISN